MNRNFSDIIFGDKLAMGLGNEHIQKRFPAEDELTYEILC